MGMHRSKKRGTPPVGSLHAVAMLSLAFNKVKKGDVPSEAGIHPFRSLRNTSNVAEDASLSSAMSFTRPFVDEGNASRHNDVRFTWHAVLCRKEDGKSDWGSTVSVSHRWANGFEEPH